MPKLALDECPYCKAHLPRPEGPEEGWPPACPRCGASFHPDQVFRNLAVFPRLLHSFIGFLREAGWTVNPPEENDFYVAATMGLKDRSAEGQSAALATISDSLVRERMRAAVTSPTDPEDYAVGSFISFLATPMGENAVFEAPKGEGIERLTTTTLETIRAQKTAPNEP